MDLLSFQAFYESNERERAANGAESAQTALYAAQATPETMKEWIEARWGPYLPKEVKAEAQAEQVSSLLNLLAKGILKKKE